MALMILMFHFSGLSLEYKLMNPWADNDILKARNETPIGVLMGQKPKPATLFYCYEEHNKNRDSINSVLFPQHE